MMRCTITLCCPRLREAKGLSHPHSASTGQSHCSSCGQGTAEAKDPPSPPPPRPPAPPPGGGGASWRRLLKWPQRMSRTWTFGRVMLLLNGGSSRRRSTQKCIGRFGQSADYGGAFGRTSGQGGKLGPCCGVLMPPWRVCFLQ